jgi:hypothetical protein
MKKLQRYRQHITVMMLLCFIVPLSFQNAIAFGQYKTEPAKRGSTAVSQEAVAPAVVVAVAETVAAAYALGYVVGRAAYYLFGDSAQASNLAVLEANYEKYDFSQFDN